jgi:aminoglycoside phosphotransferase (APT) family kinase protein
VDSVQSAQWQLNRALRVWEEDRGEDWPIMEVAANWLQRNLPVLDQVSLLHGDYRSGNFLFDQERGEITAILDWERGYLGDRHRDLAWTTAAVAGHYCEDGKTFLASGMTSTSELLDRYQALSGLSVDPKRMRFYRIFNNFQIVVTVLGSTYRVVRLGKTHQDVLLAWLEGAAYGPMEEMRRELMAEI